MKRCKLYWRPIEITDTQPVQRHTVAHIRKMITLCGIALILIICMLSAGCWDKVELENRGFIVSLGIDKYDEENQSNQAMEGAHVQNRFTVCAALPNVIDMKESAVSDKSKEVKSADSSTIWGCIQLMDAASSRKLYLGQSKLLVLGNDLLSDEKLFRQAVDAMERNRDISQKLYIMSTKGRAGEILRLPLPGEPMLGLYMVNYYKNNGSGGSISFYKVLEKVVFDLRSTGCTLIPKIDKSGATEQENNEDGDSEDDEDTAGDAEQDKKETSGSEEKKSDKITLGGCAVIKDYKLVGWLDDLETRGFAWVIKDCRGTEVAVSYDNGYIPLKIYKSKPKIKFFQQDGKLICSIIVKISGAIHEHDSDGAELYDMDYGALETAFAEAVSKEITETASKLRDKMGADVYNFKDLLRKKNYGLYKAYGDDWEKHFREMEIIPDVKVDIISIGIIK